MIRCFLIIICCSVGAHSIPITTCLQAPVGKLPEGCTIGNLIVISNSDGNDIINSLLCIDTAFSTSLAIAPKVFLRRNILLASTSKYLLTAVDRTNNKLLWMVSNVTVRAIHSKCRLLPEDPYSHVIMPYRRSDSERPQTTTVEFLVFEERRRNPFKSFSDHEINATPFNLSSWIDAQQNNEIAICGPVAGGSVVVTFRETITLSIQNPIFSFDQYRARYPNFNSYQHFEDFPRFDNLQPLKDSPVNFTLNSYEGNYTHVHSRGIVGLIGLIFVVMIRCCCLRFLKYDKPSPKPDIAFERIVIPRNEAIPMPWPGYPKST